MRRYIYEVAGFEFESAEAFGEVWKQVKAEAARLHMAIYRRVLNGEDMRKEVYCKGGYFNSTECTTPEEVKIF